MEFGEDQVISCDKSAIGMELDVYIPKYKIAIEPGSWYFYKNRVFNDIEKQKNVLIMA